MYDAVCKIIKENKDKKIAIVTHGTAIRVLMCLFKGYRLERLNDVRWCDNTAISIIDINDDNHVVIVSEGDNSHLGEYGTVSKQKWWQDTYL